MTLRLAQVSFRKIEAKDGKPRPHLLDRIEKTPRTAANVEQSQPALIAPSEDLSQLRQSLPTHRIPCSIKTTSTCVS